MFFLITKIRNLGKRINRWLFPPPYPRLTELHNSFGVGDEAPEVLCFGDSAMERVAKDDRDVRPLGQMVVDALQPRYTCLALYESSYSSDMFYYFLTALERMKHKPKIVILPINMRSFSPQWHWQPAWQFQKQIRVIKRYAKNPNQKIGSAQKKMIEEMPARSIRAFKAMPVTYPLSRLKTIGQFAELIESTPMTDDERFYRKQQIFIYHYTHPLKSDHPKLKALQDSLGLLRKMGIKTLVYLTPINFEAGKKYVGEEFSAQVRKNVELLENVITPWMEDGQVQFCDWSAAFSPDYFFNKDLATEHYRESGRQELAGKIAEQVYLF